MSNWVLAESEAEDIKVNISTTTNHLLNQPIDDEISMLVELFGSMQGLITALDIDIKHIDYYGSNCLCVTGNDGGLSDDDKNKLKYIFESGKKGHSHFGLGVRSAGLKLLDKKNHKSFMVVSTKNKKCSAIEYIFKDSDTQLKVREKTFKYEFGKSISDSMNDKEKQKGTTSWIIPLDPGLFKESIFDSIKKDLKLRFNYDIYIKKTRIFVTGSLLRIENPFFNFDNNYEPI